MRSRWNLSPFLSRNKMHLFVSDPHLRFSSRWDTGTAIGSTSLMLNILVCHTASECAGSILTECDDRCIWGSFRLGRREIEASDRQLCETTIRLLCAHPQAIRNSRRDDGRNRIRITRHHPLSPVSQHFCAIWDDGLIVHDGIQAPWDRSGHGEEIVEHFPCQT